MDWDSSKPETTVLIEAPLTRDAMGDVLYEFAQCFAKFLDLYYRTYGHEHQLSSEMIRQALGE